MVLLIIVSMVHLTLLRHETISETSARSSMGENQTEYNYMAVNAVEHKLLTVDANRMLFIHVPKCGGTAFTSLLRKIQCHRNSTAHPDCCRNPGSCYIKGFRRCISILGCVSHFPRRYVQSFNDASFSPYINACWHRIRRSMLESIKYSILLIRHPVPRYL